MLQTFIPYGKKKKNTKKNPLCSAHFVSVSIETKTKANSMKVLKTSKHFMQNRLQHKISGSYILSKRTLFTTTYLSVKSYCSKLNKNETL